MTQLGTVLPTAESLRCSDTYAARLARQQQKIGARIPDCTVRHIHGETRYAVVCRNLSIQWFEIRDDGHYRVEP